MKCIKIEILLDINVILCSKYKFIFNFLFLKIKINFINLIKIIFLSKFYN